MFEQIVEVVVGGFIRADLFGRVDGVEFYTVGVEVGFLASLDERVGDVGEDYELVIALEFEEPGEGVGEGNPPGGAGSYFLPLAGVVRERYTGFGGEKGEGLDEVVLVELGGFRGPEVFGVDVEVFDCCQRAEVPGMCGGQLGEDGVEVGDEAGFPVYEGAVAVEGEGADGC